MQQSQKIYNLIILDESGSMESIKGATISGFNEVLQTIRAAQKQFPEQKHTISFISFNTLDIKIHVWNQAADALTKIDENKYQPNACTPLYDAMGFTLTKLKKELEDVSDYHVLVTILTDGLENSSVEYNGTAIKKLVEKLKTQGWTFTYIGADHDVEKAATSISIHNSMSFSSCEGGTTDMFLRENNSRFQHYKNISEGRDLKNYFHVDEEGRPEEKEVK